MSDIGVQLLELRAEDLVVLGIGWTGMQAVGSTVSGSTVLEAPSDQSLIVLSLPPQHIADQELAVGSDPELLGGLRMFRSRLAGSSRVAFHAPRG